MSNTNCCSSILDIGATAAYDNSIVKKELYTFTPYTYSFEELDEVRIMIRNQDACLLPSESYLYMQLEVSTEKNNDAATEKIKFVHNFTSFLFTDIRYELNGVEIDRIKNAGVTSSMKLAAASCKSNTKGFCQFNEAFTGKIAQHGKKMVYDVMIPLSIWFGFCDDYRKVLLNSRHELILKIAANSLNCIAGGTNDATSTSVSVAITKIEWKMPHIVLSDDMKMYMRSFLAKNKSLPIQHRTWDLYEYPELPQTTNHIWSVKTVSQVHKPRYVFVAFQHDKNAKKIEDASKFTSMNINSLRLFLNSNVYPYHMNDVDVENGRFSELYQAYANIQSSYYNGTEDTNPFGINFKEFQTNVLFAFDTSQSEESTINGAVDIRLEIKASKNFPEKTTAYCLIIYENEFDYSPLDGTVVRRV